MKNQTNINPLKNNIMKNLILKITGITIFTLASILLAFAIIRTIELI